MFCKPFPSFLALYCPLPYQQIMSTGFIMRQVSNLHKYMWIKTCRNICRFKMVAIGWLWGKKKITVLLRMENLFPDTFFRWKGCGGFALLWHCVLNRQLPRAGLVWAGPSYFWSSYLAAAARWLFLASLYIKGRKRNQSSSHNLLLDFSQKRVGINGVCQLCTVPNRACCYWQWWA